MRRSSLFIEAALVLIHGLGSAGAARGAELAEAARQAAAQLEPFYQDLHQHPELSGQEVRTAGKLAQKLRSLGYEVSEGVGGHGVVAVLRGPAGGKTVLVRADLDALPVREDTGLPFASKSGVMHACGHDFHMTNLVAVATLLSQRRAALRGTVVLLGQPAEEMGAGAKQVLAAGLLTRFPRPDYALAIHDSAELPAGQIGYTSGPALASVDSLDVTVYGKGGHGAYPHSTVDPVVIAARAVVALQTLVARENNPLDPAVVTVGSIHGGTKHNIIPEEVRLQLTVRSYAEEVRARLLSGIRRVLRAEAEAAAAPRAPQVEITESTHATVNDAALTERAAGVFRRALGEARVRSLPPVMGAEDFSEYGRAGIPALIYWVGAVAPADFARYQAAGQRPPGIHSPRFAPDYRLALATAAHSMSALVLDLLGGAAVSAAPLQGAEQLLLVTTADFAARTGTLQRYERGEDARWRPVGTPLPVSVGRAGLGWRSDADAPPPLVPGPRKQEGDGRAPAGVLELGGLWGYAAAAPPGARLPYHAASAEDRCVDDADSPFYNQLRPEPAGGPPWRSAERMRRDDDLYRHLIVVQYNARQPRPGAGSCIFLHIHGGKGAPTAGCTAMDAGDLLTLIRWIDPARRPRLVQLPQAALAAARAQWQIP